MQDTKVYGPILIVALREGTEAFKSAFSLFISVIRRLATINNIHNYSCLAEIWRRGYALFKKYSK